MWKGSQDVLLLVTMPQYAKKVRVRMAPPLTLQLACGTGHLREVRLKAVSYTHNYYLVDNNVPPARGDIPTANQPSTDRIKVIHCLL